MMNKDYFRPRVTPEIMRRSMSLSYPMLPKPGPFRHYRTPQGVHQLRDTRNIAHWVIKTNYQRHRTIATAAAITGAAGLMTYAGWELRQSHLRKVHQRHSHRPPQLTHQQRVMMAQRRRRVAGRFA